MSEVYYKPSEIRFSRPQMLWLIEWLPVLEVGEYPKDPKDSGYTESPHVQTSHSSHAPFETAAQIYAEVTDRLKSTGESGEVLVHEVQHGLDVYELLSPPAKKALNYISGWRRREQSFARFVAQNNYRSKLNTKIPH